MTLPNQSPPLRELRGVVERITYQNADNGYTVARIASERATEMPAPGDDRLVPIVGTLPDLTPGEAIVAHGWWRNDAKHGWQFTVVDYQNTLPATVQGMQKYLGSGLVKGIGPVFAQRIVDTFGEETFDVIDASAQRLTEVPGIGRVRAQRIAATWEEQRQIREVMTILQSYSVSTSLAVRIYKRFRDESVQVLANEPYRLAREVWGIGFKTADTIARAIGMAPDAPARLEAGVLHALGTAAEDGHTLLPEERLLSEAATLLDVDRDAVAGVMESLLQSGDLMSASRVVPSDTPDIEGERTIPPDATTVSDSDRRLALAPFARAESGLAGRLRGLAGARSRSRILGQFGSTDWSVVFTWLRERHTITLAPEQEAAVRMVLTEPVSILTGGPGTGKTHTLRAILTLARAKRRRCVLAAPTGRAAKRMQEATGWEASTLHRLLGLRPGGGATLGPDNPLDADLVVVDEVSMLDTLLANQLVKAIKSGTHLLLVGDPDQLPSVGAGNVLADLLASERFPVTRLTHIFRQGAGSGIALAASRINAGEYPRFGGPSQDCFFLPVDTPAEAANLIVELVTERLPTRYGFRAGDVQVLVPMHRGEAGVGTLNQRLQERLNPGREGIAEVRAGGRVYRVGDRVLQLRNDYELEVFNGDLGMVEALDPVEQELTLRLDDGRDVAYPYGSLYALTHAYAVSVHKAQGAEFPAVVMPLLTTHAPLLSRTLLYTAVTRARQLVVLVGQRKALALAIRDWRQTTRQTALEGVLTEQVRFAWGRPTSADRREAPAGADPVVVTALDAWEGLVTAPGIG